MPHTVIHADAHTSCLPPLFFLIFFESEMFLSVNSVRIPPAPLCQPAAIPTCNTCLVSLKLKYSLTNTQ